MCKFNTLLHEGQSIPFGFDGSEQDGMACFSIDLIRGEMAWFVLIGGVWKTRAGRSGLSACRFFIAIHPLVQRHRLKNAA
jgi:hypothetical protein